MNGGLMSVTDLARLGGADIRRTKRQLKKAHAQLEAAGLGKLLIRFNARGKILVDVALLKKHLPAFLGVDTPDPCVRSVEAIEELSRMFVSMQSDLAAIRAQIRAS